MKKYTIEVSESVKDAVIEAVLSAYERAQRVAITYNDEAAYEEWLRVNEPELTHLKESTLLRYELGFDHRWEVVEEEDSAE